MSRNDPPDAERRSGRLDVVEGLPRTSAEESAALRRAAATKIGAGRALRLIEILSRTVTREQLARRPDSIGEPFSL